MGDSDLASSMSLDEDLTVGCGGCSAMGSALVGMISRNPMGDGSPLGFGVQRWICISL